MMPKIIFTGLFLLSVVVTGLADTLVLKNGLTLEGKYMGGTKTSISFETGGRIQEVAISEVKLVSFGDPQTASVPGGIALPSAAVSAPAKSGIIKVIPAETKLMIRTKEAISTSTHKKGERITAVLEKNIEVDKQIAAPKGSVLYGRVLESSGTRRAGVKRILIAFDQLVINDRPVDIKTDDVGLEQTEDGDIKTIGSGAIMTASIGAPASVPVIESIDKASTSKQIQIPEKALLVVSLKTDVRLK